MSTLSYLDALILGVVEGLTEFLPVSSTGHLTITEKLLGLKVDDPGVTAYTAIIQLGAIVATLLYFWRDIVRLAGRLGGWSAQRRGPGPTTTTSWPGPSSSARSRSGIVGFVAQGRHQRPAAQPLGRRGRPHRCGAWSMWLAESRHAMLDRRGEQRGEGSVTLHGRPGHRPRAVHGPRAGRLPLRRDDLGRAVPRARPGDRDPAVVLHGHPSPHRGGPVRGGARAVPPEAARRRARWASASSCPSSWPTPRSPGCCGSSATNKITAFVWYRVAARRRPGRARRRHGVGPGSATVECASCPPACSSVTATPAPTVEGILAGRLPGIHLTEAGPEQAAAAGREARRAAASRGSSRSPLERCVETADAARGGRRASTLSRGATTCWSAPTARGPAGRSPSSPRSRCGPPCRTTRWTARFPDDETYAAESLSGDGAAGRRRRSAGSTREVA